MKPEELVARGARRHSLVWMPGFSAWMPAHQVPELRAAFEQGLTPQPDPAFPGIPAGGTLEAAARLGSALGGTPIEYPEDAPQQPAAPVAPPIATPAEEVAEENSPASAPELAPSYASALEASASELAAIRDDEEPEPEPAPQSSRRHATAHRHPSPAQAEDEPTSEAHSSGVAPRSGTSAPSQSATEQSAAAAQKTLEMQRAALAAQQAYVAQQAALAAAAQQAALAAAAQQAALAASAVESMTPAMQSAPVQAAAPQPVAVPPQAAAAQPAPAAVAPATKNDELGALLGIVGMVLAMASVAAFFGKAGAAIIGMASCIVSICGLCRRPTPMAIAGLVLAVFVVIAAIIRLVLLAMHAGSIEAFLGVAS